MTDSVGQIPDGAGERAASRFQMTPVGWVGLTIVGFWIIVALFGPLFAPHAESDILGSTSFAPMGQFGVFGTDYLGRDVLSRILYGARMTMGLALITTLISFTLGSTMGFVAAALGGWTDNVMSRINDAVMAFPSIILALMVITALGSSLPIVVCTVAIIDATRVFRLARALAMDVSVMDFVDVARARGESVWWITLREILPNTLGTAGSGVRGPLHLRHTVHQRFVFPRARRSAAGRRLGCHGARKPPRHLVRLVGRPDAGRMHRLAHHRRQSDRRLVL